MIEHSQEREKPQTTQEGAATTVAEGKSLGNFQITHYTFALEADPKHAHSPLVSAKGLPPEHKYRQSFLGSPYGIKMQGTGLAEDGKYIHYAGNDTYAYGVGGAKGTPHAWSTCAVDPSVIPLGSHLEIDIYKNKGTFTANDTGGAIKGKHIDVFAGAIPITEAYALGTKHSEVHLVSGGGGGGGGKESTQQPVSHQTTGHSQPTHAQHGHAGGQKYHAAPTLAAVRAGHAFIRRGQEGESVKFVQHHVGVHGGVKGDGIFGPITEHAVKEYQRRHGLEVDGVVGKLTLHAFEHGAPAARHQPPGHGSGGRQHDTGNHDTGNHDTGNHDTGNHDTGNHSVGGGDAVSIARSLVRNPPLRADSQTVKKALASGGYSAAGGSTNDCADFVSSVLRMAGKISFHDINVAHLRTNLLNHGWREMRDAEKSKTKPGDVWIHLSNPSHTVLVSASGGGNTIGADGGSVEYIKEEPMPYAGGYWLTKD